ncbi:hypothetical protein [Nocardia sp. NBC_01327]|uniref:hypothetical protein n=1 Tax=Nocardia sp. NBC_01327 TaxID=2903593 RepID=UPI002E0E8DD6|nr:hypothetical protein OG326_21240 [Nocardia sp. NBC_01327]
MPAISRADFAATRARIERAHAVRSEMAKLLNESSTTFYVERRAVGDHIVIEAHAEPPIMAGIVFGDWLANIRAALDYSFFQLAIHDEQRDPPTRPRDRQFPITRTVDDFDKLRTKDVFHGMAADTVGMIESMQPYHTKYGADGNALLWLHDLARKDRHRRPFTIGTLVKSFNAKIQAPYGTNVISYDLFDPTKAPPLVGGGESFVLGRLHCKNDSIPKWLKDGVELDIEHHIELLDWFREAHTSGIAANIRNDSLQVRMEFIEYYMGLVVDAFEELTGNRK